MQTRKYKCPRIVLSGLSGGSGKTVATLGLLEIWRRNGYVVAPFKKGPDYIDTAWHSLSAGRPSHNLDTFLMQPADILQSLEERSRSADIAVVEGNRGLYDGMDAEGAHSTAELAKLIQSPVILVVNCTKATRTIAAIVLGCKMLDNDVNIGGVILNQVANIRQESVIRASVEKETGIPIVGAIPRIKGLPFSERHLGLLPPEEHPRPADALDRVYKAMLNNIDANAIWRLAASSPELIIPPVALADSVAVSETAPRIGVLRDSAFTFYYPENLEALERQGARLVEISGLRERVLPQVDALYIGGGFPETHARELANNASFRASLLSEVEAGLPVYAECGGLIFLGESVELADKRYPMTGVFPVNFAIGEKPQGHGYVVFEVDGQNPFFVGGTVFRGHEFHYARVSDYRCEDVKTVFKVKRGFGFDSGRDGLVCKNVLASFCHIHALGEKNWAKAIVNAAVSHKTCGAGVAAEGSKGAEL